jgi:uncharacterized protein (DUF927 family)
VLHKQTSKQTVKRVQYEWNESEKKKGWSVAKLNKWEVTAAVFILGKVVVVGQGSKNRSAS